MKKFKLKCNIRKYKIYLYVPKEPEVDFHFHVYVYDGTIYHRLDFRNYICSSDTTWDTYDEWAEDFMNNVYDYDIHILDSIDELKEYTEKGKLALKLSK